MNQTDSMRYWIAPNASCPDMVGWPLVARGSRGSVC
jgi:hypothetical protein